MYQTYETESLSMTSKTKFVQFLETEIGTEFEISGDDDARFYILVFELTPAEVSKIRKFENSLSD